MKNLLMYSFIIIFIISCATTQQLTLTPTEMKAISTKQFDANYDVVFRATVSLLQSEGFLVERTDRETGLINANKRIENRIRGYQEAASTSKIVFFIEQINNDITETKLTIYEGSQTRRSSRRRGNANQPTINKESIVQDAAIYQSWFYNLRAEIERRNAAY